MSGSLILASKCPRAEAALYNCHLNTSVEEREADEGTQSSEATPMRGGGYMAKLDRD